MWESHYSLQLNMNPSRIFPTDLREYSAIAPNQPGELIATYTPIPSESNMPPGITVSSSIPISSRMLLLSSSIKTSNKLDSVVVPLIVNRFGEIIWWLNPQRLHEPEDWQDFVIFKPVAPGKYGLMLQREQSMLRLFTAKGEQIFYRSRSSLPKNLSLHHDFQIRENGDIFALAQELINIPYCTIFTGWNQSKLVCPEEFKSINVKINGASLVKLNISSQDTDIV